MPKKKTREEVIALFHKKWGDQYIYDEITDENYVNTSTHVPIVCRKHGMWMQTPHDHLSGAGCPHCWEERRGLSLRVTREEFIERSNAKHGNKYIYDLVDFETTVDVVKIICPKHGVFEQGVSSHMGGQGCPHCGIERRAKARTGKPLEGARKIKYGIAKLDVDFSTTNDPIINKAYRHWTNMLQRCYSEKHRNRYTTYEGCSVCDEWLSFSNFLCWFTQTENSWEEKYHLDKDILVKNNRVYSPNTCCFIPREINALLTKRRNRRGKYPIGVVKSSKTKNYEASISLKITPNAKNKYLGSFRTPEEAFAAYKKAKEAYIKDVAEKYYKEGKIARNVYEALMNYKVEITD